MHDIPILMLHSVNDHPEQSPMGDLAVSSKGLEAYLRVFEKWNYQMISMDEFLCKRYDPDRNFVVLTFDDGYKDNLTVAMRILMNHNAHATIFVNPSYVSECSDINSDWGFLTWDEIEKAEQSGIFDIQSHTMTHEFVFTSDKIVDYYTPEKFRKYYWLAWMLFPDSPNKWNGEANRYKDMIPVGYPIFEYGRRISNKKFIPDHDYVDYVVNCYENDRMETINQYTGNHGQFETDDDYMKYVRWEIEECKSVLERKLSKTIHTICFPGGGYTEFALETARNIGYKCYIRAGSFRAGNNNDHYKNYNKGSFVGFNRTAFSLIHPGILEDSFFDYWIAKLSLGTFQNLPRYRIFKKILSKVWHT